MPVQALAAMPAQGPGPGDDLREPPGADPQDVLAAGPDADGIESSLPTYDAAARNPLLAPQAGAR